MSSPRSLVEEFLLGRALYVSAATVKGDDWYLSRFFGFLEAQGVVEVQAIREDHLSRYQHSLNEAMNRFGRPVSKSYVYRAVMVAKMFLVWAKDAGFVLLDFSSFRLEKPTRKPVVVPGMDQVALLLEAPNVETPEGLRDRLIFEFFYTLGLRRRECHGLDIEHLNFEAGTVVVAGGVIRITIIKSDRGEMIVLIDGLHHLLKLKFTTLQQTGQQAF